MIRTISLHSLTQSSGGGSQQCADVFRTIQTSRSEEDSELIRAQIEVRTQSGLQQTVQRRQTHRPTKTHSNYKGFRFTERKTLLAFLFIEMK